MTTITLHEALKVVSEHCDHARSLDNVGFSGHDAHFANDIAAREPDRISPKVEFYIAKFVRKYRRQVVERFEARGEQITQGLKGKAKVAAVDAFLASLVWEHQSEAEVAAASAPKLVISAAAGVETGTVKHFVVRFPYNENTLTTFKNAVADYRDRRFDKSDPKDPKWIVQPTIETVRQLRFLASSCGFFATPGALLAFDKIAPAVAA
jgi:hypothetical protein